MSKHTRVVAISDLHCGALTGLTHPSWQVAERGKTGRTKRNKLARLQRETWDAYRDILTSIEPIDKLLYLGDGIDGPGDRSGGTEQITTDMEEQADMCVACIDEVRLHGRKGAGDLPIAGVYGTPYHTGKGADFENIVADRAGFQKIGSHEWPEIEGVVFDIKHKVGSSSVPHGRATAISKEMLWNTLWAEAKMQPAARVVLRGHVHYHEYRGDPYRIGMTLPALQAMGTKYGARQCSGLVHWGLVHFDVSGGEVIDWHAHVRTIRSQVATTTVM